MAFKAIRPDHVAIYVRWSTDDQSHGTTLQEQTEGCKHYVLSQGWQFRDDLVFIDDGWSGGSLERPRMERLRHLVRVGEIDCVVVLKLDRLARNIVDAVDLVLREWDDQCYIKSVREPIDTTTDIGRVIFTMLSSFADFERYQITNRTQSGKERRIRDGKQMHGEPAFGYKRHPEKRGVWVEDESESALLRQIFEWCDQGTAANAIMRQLNQSGCRTRAGNEWNVRGLLHILRNRTYIGEAVYGATSLRPIKKAGGATPPQSSRMGRPPTMQARQRVVNVTPKFSGVTTAAPALIDSEQFERVQKRLVSNRTRKQAIGGRGMSSGHLLTGLLQCSCGAAMHYKPNRVRGKIYEYYRCLRGTQGTCDANGHIPADLIEDLVVTQFLSLYGTDISRRAKLEPHIQAADAQCHTIEVELTRAQAELQKLSEEDAGLIRKVRAGEMTMADRAEVRQYIQTDMDVVRDRIHSLELSLHDVQANSEGLRTRLQALSDAAMWTTLDKQKQRQLLSLVLRDKITVSKPKGQDDITITAPWAY